MKLTYIYHSGYLLQTDRISVIFDFWRDTVDETHGAVHDWLCQTTNPVYVLVSHVHPDHFNPEILEWAEQYSNVHLILSNDIFRFNRHNPKISRARFLKRTEVYEDENLRIEAFGSTDVGVSFALRIDGIDIFHAGDFANWLWRPEMSANEAKNAEYYYLEKLNTLAQSFSHFHLALLPLDPRLGAAFTRGPQQLLSAIKVDVLAPMHFELLPNQYGVINAFAPTAESMGVRFLFVHGPGDCFDV